MTKTVEYVLSHAQDTLDYIECLEGALRTANLQLQEATRPPSLPPKKRWWQK
jgi:hypothetical protein